MENLLTVQNLYFSYLDNKNNYIIDDFSFFIRKSEILGISGKSGTGKSTLVRLLSGIEKNYSGEIIKDCDIKILPLFQNSEELINPNRKVESILKDSIKRSPFNNEEISSLLESLGITEDELSKVGYELSGGKRQKVGLARIMLLKPDILLLDEPFVAQDAKSRISFSTLLKEFVQRYGTSIIIFSHKIDLLRNIADRIISLDK